MAVSGITVPPYKGCFTILDTHRASPYDSLAQHVLRLVGIAMRTSKISQSPQATDEQSVGQVMDALRAMVRVWRVESPAIERLLSISLAQLWVLRRLNEGAIESLTGLAAEAGTHQSSMSVVVRRLVERHLVIRVPDPRDRRRQRLELTDAGRDLVQKAPATFDMNLVGALHQMAPESRAALAVLMREWLLDAGINPKKRLPLAWEEPD